MSTSGLTQTGAVSSLKAWKYGSAVPALVTFREEAGQRSSLLLDRPRRDAGYTGVVEFEWDPKKAGENLKKHGVEFVEAATVFADPLSITVRDPDHSETENRLIIVGYSNRFRPLAVSHIDHDGRVRIISARQLTSDERHDYEEEKHE